MKAKYIVLLFVVGLTTGALIQTPSENQLQIDADVVKTLQDDEVVFAGSVEGKAFFAVRHTTIRQNWAAAKDACEQMQPNMKLAEITSAEQANVLKTMHGNEHLWGQRHWVAAKDSWSSRQFSWESSNDDVSTSGVNVIRDNWSPKTPLTCLVFDTVGGRLHLRPCESPEGYRLCEISIASLFIN